MDPAVGPLSPRSASNFIAFRAVQEMWPRPGETDIHVDKRINFLNNNHVDSEGNTTGLGATPAGVHRLNVRGLDGVVRTSVCIVTQGGNIYEFVRRLRRAIYGEVIYANVIINTGGANGLVQDRRYVAVKRLVRAFVGARQVASGDGTLSPMQEDPLVELTCLKYVSRPGHPHVVNVLEILDDGRSIYKIEEFAGSELYGVLTDRSLHPSGRFSEAAVRRYFIQILQGVQYLHNKGIVHLDSSLENLLLDDSDNIKIIDFGMARMIPVDASTGERRIFPPHSMRPTNKTFYMAPEVFASGEFDGEKADLWSCTTMLFIMLTGLPAFVYPDSTDTRFLAIKDGNLMALMDSFNVSGFLSDAVKELLVLLFVVDFRRRPSVEEILSHRWFTV